ncbi:MAG: hypothetical protein M3Q46_12125 [Verrucomicrobiota bacterium]|nr:hypothetical protein [Verrucomicrobiota bacterium]
MKIGSTKRGGFTLVEMSVAGGVALIIGLILFFALSEGVWLFRANESEMWARDNGSSVIRAIQDDLQSAQTAAIYPDYTQVNGTEINYGSCAVVNLPEGPTTITYYWWQPLVAPKVGPVLGRIYSHTGTTALNSATDILLASNVTSFEFRRNPNGTVRVGFAVGILGYPRRLLGSIEPDLLRFSTSAIPRNP